MRLIQIPLPAIISIALPLWVWLRIRNVDRTENFSGSWEFFVNLFFVYGCALFIATMRPFMFQFPWIGSQKAITFDIYLFEELRHMAVGSELLQLFYSVGNVMMFIPFGFLIPFLFPFARHFFITVALGFSLSFTIEMVQMLFTFTRRGTIDDLVFNTIGAMIGYVLFRMIDDVGFLRKMR